MKRSDSNFSKSATFSPVPIYITGAPVVATADSAPPPLAVPSSLVITIPVTPAKSWKLAATGPADCPTCASITKNLSFALATSEISSSSTTNSSSNLCLPAVSMIIKSAAACSLKPLRTISTALVFSGSPYTSTVESSSNCDN